MNIRVKAGIVLGLLVAVWTFVMGFTGWYKDPALAWLFTPGAIIVQVAVLLWALRITALEPKRYGGQVLAGLTISVIAGLLIILSSFVFTTVAFPDYFDEIRAYQLEQFEDQGMSQEQIDQAMAIADKLMTPTVQAVFGFVGTVITGLIASLIIAIFVREKS